MLAAEEQTAPLPRAAVAVRAHDICVEHHAATHLITHFPADRPIMPIVITSLQPSAQCLRYILKHFQLLNFSPVSCIIHIVLF